MRIRKGTTLAELREMVQASCGAISADLAKFYCGGTPMNDDERTMEYYNIFFPWDGGSVVEARPAQTELERTTRTGVVCGGR